MIILLVALVVLGPQRLPDVARQMGQTVSTLRSLAGSFQAEIDAAAKPTEDSSMSLAGPTSQSDAIAQTQQDGAPEDRAESDTEAEADAPGDPEAHQSEPIVASAPFAAVTTDPEELAAQARAVTYDDDAEEVAQSEGGPVDLRDEEE